MPYFFRKNVFIFYRFSAQFHTILKQVVNAWGNAVDCLHLRGIRGYGYTGVLPEEQILGQWFEVNLQIYLDLSLSGQSDVLADTLHYGPLIAQVQEIIRRSHYALVERLAAVIADAVLEYPIVEQVQVCLIKNPPIPDFGGQIQVEILRSKGSC
jgi:7,8-dihydroneopterin aldolase/epimerase/oxygenase